MKVMLIQLPHLYNNTTRPPTYYPLGLGYIASILSPIIELIPLDLWANNQSDPSILATIKNHKPDVICISVYSTQYSTYKRIVKLIKANFPTIPIIAGGPGATFSYTIILNETATDICVLGEGEETLPELLQNLHSKDRIHGIAYKTDSGTVHTTQARQLIKNLDSLPFPNRQFFDQQKYIENSKKSPGVFTNKRSINIIAGRGCPYQCTYCSKTFPGARLRSIDSIINEIKLLKSSYNIEAIDFNDELVIITEKRAFELSEAIAPLNLQWACQGRINIASRDLFKAMHKSGCSHIGFGVESYDQRILDRMNKKINTKDIIPAINTAKQSGIIPLIQYMFGFPGEDIESIKRTKHFFSLIDHPYIGSATTPLPGTKLYQEAIKKDLIRDEIAYLESLSSGYNEKIPRINMTDFTSSELKVIQKQLEQQINRSYYLRHPFKYIISKQKRLQYLFSFFINDPMSFSKKLLYRLTKKHER